jgi:hypothetical protein
MKRGEELNMAHRESHHETASRWQHYPAGLEAVAESLQRRGDIRYGGINGWFSEAIGRWFKWISTQPDGDFRTDESVHEQHFRASLPKDDWRVAYGIDSPQARALVSEIKWHRKHGLSLDGLAWPSSDDLYAPANDPNHPYYLPKESE